MPPLMPQLMPGFLMLWICQWRTSAAMNLSLELIRRDMSITSYSSSYRYSDKYRYKVKVSSMNSSQFQNNKVQLNSIHWTCYYESINTRKSLHTECNLLTINCLWTQLSISICSVFWKLYFDNRKWMVNGCQVLDTKWKSIIKSECKWWWTRDTKVNIANGK